MNRACYFVLMRMHWLVPHIPRKIHVWMCCYASGEAARRGEW